MEYMTTKEVAGVLKCTPRTVVNLIRRGAFPGAFRVDPDCRSHWRIPMKDLARLINKMTIAEKGG